MDRSGSPKRGAQLAASDKSGYLAKQVGTLRSTWREMFCVLADKQFLFYENKLDSRPAGVLSARGVDVGMMMHDGRMCIFLKVDKKQHWFAVRDPVEGQEWISKLTTCAGCKVTVQPPPDLIAAPSTPGGKANTKRVLTALERDKIPASYFFNPDMCGMLTKQGKEVKNWKERWCVLDNSVFYYYKSKKDTAPAGWFDCYAIKVGEQPYEGKRNCFFADDGNRVYWMTAKDRANVVEWIDAFVRFAKCTPANPIFTQSLNEDGTPGPLTAVYSSPTGPASSYDRSAPGGAFASLDSDGDPRARNDAMEEAASLECFLCRVALEENGTSTTKVVKVLRMDDSVRAVKLLALQKFEMSSDNMDKYALYNNKGQPMMDTQRVDPANPLVQEGDFIRVAMRVVSADGGALPIPPSRVSSSRKPSTPGGGPPGDAPARPPGAPAPPPPPKGKAPSPPGASAPGEATSPPPPQRASPTGDDVAPPPPPPARGSSSQRPPGDPSGVPSPPGVPPPPSGAPLPPPPPPGALPSPGAVDSGMGVGAPPAAGLPPPPPPPGPPAAHPVATTPPPPPQYPSQPQYPVQPQYPGQPQYAGGVAYPGYPVAAFTDTGMGVSPQYTPVSPPPNPYAMGQPHAGPVPGHEYTSYVAQPQVAQVAHPGYAPPSPPGAPPAVPTSIAAPYPPGVPHPPNAYQVPGAPPGPGAPVPQMYSTVAPVPPPPPGQPPPPPGQPFPAAQPLQQQQQPPPPPPGNPPPPPGQPQFPVAQVGAQTYGFPVAQPQGGPMAPPPSGPPQQSAPPPVPTLFALYAAPPPTQPGQQPSPPPVAQQPMVFLDSTFALPPPPEGKPPPLPAATPRRSNTPTTATLLKAAQAVSNMTNGLHAPPSRVSPPPSVHDEPHSPHPAQPPPPPISNSYSVYRSRSQPPEQHTIQRSLLPPAGPAIEREALRVLGAGGSRIDDDGEMSPFSSSDSSDSVVRHRSPQNGRRSRGERSPRQALRVETRSPQKQKPRQSYSPGARKRMSDRRESLPPPPGGRGVGGDNSRSAPSPTKWTRVRLESDESPGIRVRALFDYAAQGPMELSFRAGDEIRATDTNDADWWEGVSARGQRGMFPSAYFEFVGSVPVAAVVRSTKLTKCRALFDYTAQGPDELSFRAGDDLFASDTRDPNWWHGATARGERGVFPRSYCSLLDLTSYNFDLSRSSARGSPSSMLRNSPAALQAGFEYAREASRDAQAEVSRDASRSRSPTRAAASSAKASPSSPRQRRFSFTTRERSSRPSPRENGNANGEVTRCRALFEYAAQGPDELSFRAGDDLFASDTRDADWWHGATARGDRGVFPSVYVEVTRYPSLLPPAPLFPKAGRP